MVDPMQILGLIPPALLLSTVIASAYAALYNLWRNGSPRDLLFCLIAAWAGFTLGQVAGWLLQLNWGMIGSIYMVEGTLFTWLMLFLMNWLRMPAIRASAANEAERQAEGRSGRSTRHRSSKQ
jgi:hypothetical protein